MNSVLIFVRLTISVKGTILSVAAPIFGHFYAVLPVAASKIGFLSVIGSPDNQAFSMYVHAIGKVSN